MVALLQARCLHARARACAACLDPRIHGCGGVWVHSGSRVGVEGEGHGEGMTKGRSGMGAGLMRVRWLTEEHVVVLRHGVIERIGSHDGDAALLREGCRGGAEEHLRAAGEQEQLHWSAGQFAP